MMRAPELYPLFQDISNLKGVGTKTRGLVAASIGERALDVVLHIPFRYEQWKVVEQLTNVASNEHIIAPAHILYHEPPPNRQSRLPYRIYARVGGDSLVLAFFKVKGDYLSKSFPQSATLTIAGKVERYGNQIQIVHPVVMQAQSVASQHIEPVYSLPTGVYPKQWQQMVATTLQSVPKLPEWINASLLAKEQWAGFKESLAAIHHPPYLEEEEECPAVIRNRLAYDELFASQLALKLRRHHSLRQRGQALHASGELAQQLASSLPFSLTNGQKQVIEEICSDLTSDMRMLRLLQGDVGSGKTLVALMAALNAIEAGKQVALMAPTEILALQHFETISAMLEPLGISTAVLTGKLKAKNKREVLQKLEDHSIQFVIGTHALFQKDVIFADLGFVIIDEQHRFGVEQRIALTDKGTHTDCLLMSATPIPRTLTLSIYGDMDCSRLVEKPQGRLAIDTRVVPVAKLADVAHRLQHVMERGEKIYWICPLVSESETTDLTAVEERFDSLKSLYPYKVGIVHGQMPQEQREATMLEFRDGDIDVLVATTVIEVGVDVKDATVIIIEHAERFGLSQLHQLRGRVGRNDKQSSCVLLYDSLSQTGRKRLEVMRDTNDGFYLSEEDLKIRGGGDVLGTRQSGMPDFKIAHLFRDRELLYIASKDAAYLVQQDPHLQSERGKACRFLLQLMQYDNATRLVTAG